MPTITFRYSASEVPWLEVWLANFIQTRQGVPMSRQEMILEALRVQAESDLSKVLSFDQMRVLFYPGCNPVVDLERLNLSQNDTEYVKQSCGYANLLTLHELVGFVASHAGINPKCIVSTLKTVGRTRTRQIRIQFATWKCPVFYHPSDKTRDTWELQGYT